MDSMNDGDMAVPNETQSNRAAFTAQVNSPRSFYIIPVSRIVEFNQMVDNMAEAGSFAKVPANSVIEDDIYAGLFESGVTFYRCQVIQKNDDDLYKVIFIDCGNEVATRDL